MSTVSTEATPVQPEPESLEERFRRLYAAWRAGTAFISSSTVICNDPALLEIVSLGEPVVSLILRELEHGPRFLVWALRRITDQIETLRRPGVEEAINALRIGMQKAGFRGKEDTQKLIEALEGLEMKESDDFPQGDKLLRKEDHQAFLREFIFEIQGGKYKILETVPKEKTIVPVVGCKFA
jgi:hypothetical protein